MVPATQAPQIRNKLVWVASSKAAWPPESRLPPTLGRLAIADPSHVPAGIYARNALRAMGWWSTLEPAIHPGADVRTALRYVLQGEVDAAIVYRSETRKLPTGFRSWALPVQPEIKYTIAARPSERADASRFLKFLNTSEAATILDAYGFSESAPSTPTQGGSLSVLPILTLSLKVALTGVLVSLFPGIIMGWLLARRQFGVKSSSRQL